MGAYNEHTGAGPCPHDIIDNTSGCGLQRLGEGVDRFLYRYKWGARIAIGEVRAEHASLRYAEASAIGHDLLLKGDFRPVCEGGNHGGHLAPFFLKAALSRRIAVGIVKSLYIAKKTGRDDKIGRA